MLFRNNLTLLPGLRRTSSRSTGGGIGSSRDENYRHRMWRVECYQAICRYGPGRSFIHNLMQLTVLDQLQETAKFKGQFFADPTRKLYHALGMDIESLERTPRGQPRPSYLSFGIVSGIMRSLWVKVSCLAS